MRVFSPISWWFAHLHGSFFLYKINNIITIYWHLLCFIQFCLSQAHIYDNDHKTCRLREFKCVFSYILTFQKSLKVPNSVCCHTDVLCWQNCFIRLWCKAHLPPASARCRYILQTQPWVFESSIWEMCHAFTDICMQTQLHVQNASESHSVLHHNLVTGLTTETIWTDSLMCIKVHQLHVLLVGNQ